MILVIIEIHHAICEYKKNHKIILRFEKIIAENIYIDFLWFLFLMILLNNEQYIDYLIDLLATYHHVRHTWKDQIVEKHEQKLQIIFNQVKYYTDYDKKLKLDNILLIINLFKNFLIDFDNSDVEYFS